MPGQGAYNSARSARFARGLVHHALALQGYDLHVLTRLPVNSPKSHGGARRLHTQTHTHTHTHGSRGQHTYVAPPEGPQLKKPRPFNSHTLQCGGNIHTHTHDQPQLHKRPQRAVRLPKDCEVLRVQVQELRLKLPRKDHSLQMRNSKTQAS